MTKDLIKWGELPRALYLIIKSISSLAARLLTKNTSGLGKENKVPIIAIYTMHDADKKKQGTLDAQAQDMAIHLMRLYVEKV